MSKKRKAKQVSLIGLFLLAAFLNMYLVQLACNLPHLAQRLLPASSSENHHHSATPEGQVPTHGHTEEHAHEESHSHSDGEDCCKGKDYAPFVKAAPSAALLSFDKVPLTLPGAYYPTEVAFIHKSHLLPLSHAPPDPPVPKIPDIRIFLHSLTI